jgi:transketolase
MRLLRGNVPTVLQEYDYRFELGKAAELRTGRDVVLMLDDHALTGRRRTARG